tara:strand:- start:1128 stop:1328 length:201 start_codon:yes stop_codon:yes gene_type:complete
MENYTPFHDAIVADVKKSKETEIKILRENNRKMKLEIIELKQELNSKEKAKLLLNNINFQIREYLK